MLSAVVNSRKYETASTWLTETCTGSHLFKLTGYSFVKGIGYGNCISSGTFTVGGYNWTIRYYPDRNSYSQEYLSFDLFLGSDTKARVEITLSMLSQTGGRPHMRYSSGAVTISPNCSWNCPLFIKGKEFETSKCLKNDSFTVRCTLTVFKCSSLQDETNCKAHPLIVQPSNLHQHLTSLLESGDGADISFKVSGVTFKAHRCIVAARSLVFRAELFGPMKVKRNQTIEIKDMDPSIFKKMLQFIYTDSLPELEVAKGNKDGSVALAQHLLVAADRYKLERLKEICEIAMYKFC
ncbi:BTB/POZ and MATH domain-containing protein 2 [Rhynchospora pubera]|uniref:BTB/POZ and MATH domain-containing protein 2 n=1 Tax=Rhynchospora pubera TaxID=906938 RepID=A0AAV8DH87_9POAL|nr:BTB/POZ and MATH domain-containing protein 2 [Rhynchospora pubera]